MRGKWGGWRRVRRASPTYHLPLTGYDLQVKEVAELEEEPVIHSMQVLELERVSLGQRAAVAREEDGSRGGLPGEEPVDPQVVVIVGECPLIHAGAVPDQDRGFGTAVVPQAVPALDVVLRDQPQEDGPGHLVFDLQPRDVAVADGAPVAQANELLALVCGVDPDLVGRAEIHRRGYVVHPRGRPLEEVFVLSRQHAQECVAEGPLWRLDAATDIPVLQPVGAGEGNRIHHRSLPPLDRVIGEEVGIVLERLGKEETADLPATPEANVEAVVVLDVAQRSAVEQVVVPAPVDAEWEAQADGLDQPARFSEEREAVVEIENRVVLARDESALRVEVGAQRAEGVAEREFAAGAIEDGPDHWPLRVTPPERVMLPAPWAVNE